MDKNERNEFYLNNKESIENKIGYAINNIQHLEGVRRYTGDYKLKFCSYKHTNLASPHLNFEDLEQQLLLEVFEALREKDTINLSYVGKRCELRLKNILRRHRLEAKMRIRKEEFEAEDHSASPDLVVSDINNRIIIEKALLMINDPKEKLYLITLAGNLGVKGYEKHAIQKTTADESDDFCTAKKLGFDNAKKYRYVVIKKNVIKVLAEVMESMEILH